MSEKNKNEEFGTEVNEDIGGFTPEDQDVIDLMEKYGHDITVVVFMGSVDGAPSFGVKSAGANEKHLHAGNKLGEVIMQYLQFQFKNYVEKSKGEGNGNS